MSLMSSERLTRGEARSLVCLLEFALDEARPSMQLRSAAGSFPRGRLRRTVEELAADLEDGLKLSVSLQGKVADELCSLIEAAEEAGDLPACLPRLKLALERSARRHELVFVPAAVPLLSMSVGLAACGLLVLLVAPSYAELHRQGGSLLGGAESSGSLAWLAEHAPLVGPAFFLAALLPLGLPLILALVARTQLGSAAVLHLPVLGRLARTRALAEFSTGFGALLAAGMPDHQSFSSAAAQVVHPSLRARLQAASRRFAAGDPIAELLPAAGLAEDAGVAFLPNWSHEDGGAATAEALARDADQEHRELLALCGRGCALAAQASTVILLFALMMLVFRPMLGMGV